MSLKLATELYGKVKGGGDIAKLAKDYSSDGSAGAGGDLNWADPTSYVPEFKKFCLTHKKGEVGLVKTQFGWHILEVLESRNQNNTAQQQEEDTVRASIRKQKYEDELQKWLRQIRQEAFVDIKLDK